MDSQRLLGEWFKEDYRQLVGEGCLHGAKLSSAVLSSGLEALGRPYLLAQTLDLVSLTSHSLAKGPFLCHL